MRPEKCQKSVNAVDPNSPSSVRIKECIAVFHSGFPELDFEKVGNDKINNDEVTIAMAQQALHQIDKLNKAFSFFKPPAANLELTRDLKEALKNTDDGEKLSKINESIGKYIESSKPSKEVFKILESCSFSVEPAAYKPSDKNLQEMSPSKPGAGH